MVHAERQQSILPSNVEIQGSVDTPQQDIQGPIFEGQFGQTLRPEFRSCFVLTTLTYSTHDRYLSMFQDRLARSEGLEVL